MNWRSSTITSTQEPGPAAERRSHLSAEWALQSAVLLAWPHAQTDWQGSLPEIDRCYCELTAAIARFENVLICVADEILRGHVLKLLRSTKVDLDKIIFATVPYNDTWTRDYGPLFINTNERTRLLDFQFNGWGGRYSAELDNQVTQRLHHSGFFGNSDLMHIPWVLEGGAIDTNGEGVALTTLRCLTQGNRNGGPGQSQIETLLYERLGIHTVLWLSQGNLEGDDTDGHIDQLARFCTPDTIAYCADAGSDAQARSLQAMEDELQSLRQADGTPFQLIPLPVPQTIHNSAGERLPASYVNFLIINDAVLVPSYDDPADLVAQQRLQACFPEREIVPIPAQALIEQGGSVHCATMQLPAGVFTPVANRTHT